MRKRIALVVNTLSGGGAEKVVSNLSRSLAGQYDIDIIVNDMRHLDYPYRGRIISLKMPEDRGTMLFQIQVVARRIRVLRYLKKRRDYAAVISFSGMCNVSNVLSGTQFAKTILTVHNSLTGERDTSWVHKILSHTLMPWCYRKADLTVSVSKGIKDELEKNRGLPPERSKVIYNGTETALIWKKARECPAEFEKEKKDGKKLIVSVGRLTRQKGHRYLLKAVKILKSEGVPIHLVLLGEGELREELENQAAQLGISEDLTFAGFVENPYKYMAHADAVVMPSLYEGFSNVLIEALACGALVISTDHETGAREILAPDTDYRNKVKDRVDMAKYGILVPVFDPEVGRSHGRGASKEESLMAEAIKKVISDPELARHYREASLERAKQMDIKSICGQWIEVIEG